MRTIKTRKLECYDEEAYASVTVQLYASVFPCWGGARVKIITTPAFRVLLHCDRKRIRETRGRGRGRQRDEERTGLGETAEKRR